MALLLIENAKPGAERIRLPDTIDRDEFELEGPLQPVCYFIIGGNEEGMFKLEKLSHTLMVNTVLCKTLNSNNKENLAGQHKTRSGKARCLYFVGESDRKLFRST